VKLEPEFFSEPTKFSKLSQLALFDRRRIEGMWMTKLRTGAAILAASVTVTGGGLLAQTALAPKSASPVAVAGAKSQPADSAAMAETEAKLAKLRELVRPKPGEHVTNIAKIAWERDPWAAAGKAAKEGKPVIAYGPGMVGLPCGYG
jgi:hypothetical protein